MVWRPRPNRVHAACVHASMRPCVHAAPARRQFTVVLECRSLPPATRRRPQQILVDSHFPSVQELLAYLSVNFSCLAQELCCADGSVVERLDEVEHNSTLILRAEDPAHAVVADDTDLAHREHQEESPPCAENQRFSSEAFSDATSEPGICASETEEDALLQSWTAVEVEDNDCDMEEQRIQRGMDEYCAAAANVGMATPPPKNAPLPRTPEFSNELNATFVATPLPPTSSGPQDTPPITPPATPISVSDGISEEVAHTTAAVSMDSQLVPSSSDEPDYLRSPRSILKQLRLRREREVSEQAAVIDDEEYQSSTAMSVSKSEGEDYIARAARERLRIHQLSLSIVDHPYYASLKTLRLRQWEYERQRNDAYYVNTEGADLKERLSVSSVSGGAEQRASQLAPSASAAPTLNNVEPLPDHEEISFDGDHESMSPLRSRLVALNRELSSISVGDDVHTSSLSDR